MATDARPTILIQLDSDSQPSVFDGVVAVDAGIGFLFRHSGVRPEAVRDLVYGAIFTRGVEDLRRTALFIGGSDVAAGEALLDEVRRTFFGPMRVSVMMDSNGSNTTAAAAVLAAGKHLTLDETTALVLAATGPVGRRVVELLAREGAAVRAASRRRDRAAEVCQAVAAKVPGSRLTPCAPGTPAEIDSALEGVQLVIAAGAAGIRLLTVESRRRSRSLQVAIDLNAVAPAGIEGIAPTDRAVEHDEQTCYGAIGVGGLKMKIHKAALRRLFDSNDQVLDAPEILAIGRSL